ncbi:MAG: NAD-dependent deacylase [Acidiferrobacterales bacterium]
MASVDTIRGWLRESQHVTVLTGAGISAESGVPLFRGAGGLWQKHRPEDLATPQAFARNPQLVWEWYDWRRARVAEAKPNPGHYALAGLEQRVPDFTLITQNVDGLHDRAGSRNILKLHGDIWQLRCTYCGEESDNVEVPLAELPPYCSCGSLLRPAVVWFGESLSSSVLQSAADAATRAQVFLVIGTSALVQPAASLPLMAKQNDTRLIEINPQATPLSAHADINLVGPAGELLPELMAALGSTAH